MQSDYEMRPDQLDTKYNPDGDGEHPTWTRSDWRIAVGDENTISGYWEWVSEMLTLTDSDI